MRTAFKVLSVFSFGLMTTAACSGGGNNSDAGTDAQADVVVHKEASAPLDAGDGAVQCTANSSYSGPLSQETATYTAGPGADAGTDAGSDAGPQDSYQFQGAYNSDVDLFDIEIYDGFGVFTNGIQPGTYDLKGDELDYATCGLCVLVLGDSSSSSSDPYMATGGSITITSISPNGTFAGTGTNLTFTHVSIDQSNTSTPLNDGCNTSIASVSFSATVQ